MAESIILNSPILLALYGISLGLLFIVYLTKTHGPILPFASIILLVFASIYAILLGANLLEVAIALIPFFLFLLFILRRKIA